MNDNNIIKHYNNGEITIQWEPSKCIHSGICVKSLPSVFKPKDRPWIQMENGTTSDIEKAIDNCPSGALSYTSNLHDASSSAQPNVEVKVIPDGPLMIKGDFLLSDKEGQNMPQKGNNALCRCGASQNKPFCDGAHRNIHFKG